MAIVMVEAGVIMVQEAVMVVAIIEVETDIRGDSKNKKMIALPF